MRGKETKNKGLIVLLAIVILATAIIMPTQEPTAASATTTKYMKVNTFIKHLVQTIDLQVDITVKTPYIAAALKAGIVIEGEFTDYNSYITRTDAAVLINRADEYLHSDKVDKKLLKIILDKRISDIKNVPEEKREAVAKVYAKGIIKGYSNGNYTQDRSFKGNDNITAAGAMSAIKLVKNTANRSKISQDGQLIRTTNLPKNADKYEYILASFPNKFYEKKFRFMFSKQYENGTRNREYYAYPVEMKNRTFKTWTDEWAFTIERDKYQDKWVAMAEEYLNYVFNVDYRTIDDEWISGLASLYVNSGIDYEDDIKTYYLNQMKENKVIIESSLISVEPSTLYEDTNYCIRAYVRYRITAKDINVKQNKLLYSQYPQLENLKNGEWRTGIFDIEFGTNNGYQGDGSYWKISDEPVFNDSRNVSVKD